MLGTDYSCSRAVFTVIILDTREHDPSRSAGAIVNDVIIIFYLKSNSITLAGSELVRS